MCTGADGCFSNFLSEVREAHWISDSLVITDLLLHSGPLAYYQERTWNAILNTVVEGWEGRIHSLMSEKRERNQSIERKQPHST